jgi:hypothetical protein
MPTTSHQPTAQTVTKRTHPIDQGWLHGTFTLHHADRLTQDAAEIIVYCFSDPKNYDIALCAQNGKTLKGVIRRKDWKPEAS